MAGSILGKDQIDKVNAAYKPLLAHLRNLLLADTSPYGLMKLHFAIEGLDSTELYAIFSKLTFLSPAEKRALVRAAIFDVLKSSREELEAIGAVEAPKVENVREETRMGLNFQPPQFNLNPATVTTHQEAAKPVATAPTEKHGSKVQRRIATTDNSGNAG